MHPLLATAVDLVLPRRCAGCGAADAAAVAAEVCAACALALAPHPRVRQVRDIPVTSALRYDGAAARVIAAYKQGRIGLGRVLAPAMGGAVRAAVADALADRPGALAVVGAPARWEARVRRGWRPLDVLLSRAGVPHHRLLTTSRTADQRALDETARAANVAGRMRAAAPLGGLRVLLVDDIVTTGATLVEMARAVRAAGGSVVGAATLASTPRRVGRVGTA